MYNTGFAKRSLPHAFSKLFYTTILLGFSFQTCTIQYRFLYKVRKEGCNLAWSDKRWTGDVSSNFKRISLVTLFNYHYLIMSILGDLVLIMIQMRFIILIDNGLHHLYIISFLAMYISFLLLFLTKIAHRFNLMLGIFQKFSGGHAPRPP